MVLCPRISLIRRQAVPTFRGPSGSPGEHLLRGSMHHQSRFGLPESPLLGCFSKRLDGREKILWYTASLAVGQGSLNGGEFLTFSEDFLFLWLLSLEYVGGHLNLLRRLPDADTHLSIFRSIQAFLSPERCSIRSPSEMCSTIRRIEPHGAICLLLGVRPESGR